MMSRPSVRRGTRFFAPILHYGKGRSFWCLARVQDGVKTATPGSVKAFNWLRSSLTLQRTEIEEMSVIRATSNLLLISKR